MNSQQYISHYLNEVEKIAQSINTYDILELASRIRMLQNSNNRLFILGLGGSAANSSHAVNDFRKILQIESYTPSDNVSELTARINDDGWNTSYSQWLKVSNLRRGDALLVFSVGGGSETTSYNIVEAMKYANSIGAQVYSIVSRDGGFAKHLSDCYVLIPVISYENITPHAEEWQGIIWHLIVSCIKNFNSKINIDIYADVADIDEIYNIRKNGIVSGFTTNPTIMRKAGITDYSKFAKLAAKAAYTLPISFEVFSDDFDEMYEQAKILRSFGENVYVKIPITNTKGEYSTDLIRRLDAERIKLNITAIFTIKQVKELLNNISGDFHIISVFAGRIADSGTDPVPIMSECLREIKNKSSYLKLLWASPREVLNIYQANEIGCDIITVTPDLLAKLELQGKNLTEFSRETVEMFYNDAKKSGFQL